MSVLGVKAPQVQRFDSPSMKVFVEVYNPTRTHLQLKRLKYQLVASNLVDTRGEVKVERLIGAGASAIVEILVPIEDNSDPSALSGVPYTLKARLFAVSDKTERSWELRSSGALASSKRTSRRRPLQVASGR